jgi:hypothetical protein
MNTHICAEGEMFVSSQPDVRKALRVDKPMAGENTEESAETGGDESPDDPSKAAKSRLARTISSLFGNRVVSTQGISHFEHGAVDHRTYLERAIELGVNVADCRLSQDPSYGGRSDWPLGGHQPRRSHRTNVTRGTDCDKLEYGELEVHGRSFPFLVNRVASMDATRLQHYVVLAEWRLAAYGLYQWSVSWVR